MTHFETESRSRLKANRAELKSRLKDDRAELMSRLELGRLEADRAESKPMERISGAGLKADGTQLRNSLESDGVEEWT